MSSSDGLRNRKVGPVSTKVESSESRDTSPTGPRMAMSAAQVAKDEKKKSKLIVRVIWSFIMISVFGGCVLMGHLYVCGVVALAEVMLFRELVKVRYNAYFAQVQDTVPLFRTTQWAWFSVAIFYTYGDFISEVVQSNKDLHYLVPYAEYSKTIAFTLYSAVFVMTIATMKAGHIKFQLNQLCWTVLVLCWTLGQMKYIMHNVFNGLIWFTLPFLLVCCNDVMAYFCGRAFGKKFIQRPLIWFSPNKTWEGFIGASRLSVRAMYWTDCREFSSKTALVVCLFHSLYCMFSPILDSRRWYMYRYYCILFKSTIGTIYMDDLPGQQIRALSGPS